MYSDILEDGFVEGIGKPPYWAELVHLPW